MVFLFLDIYQIIIFVITFVFLLLGSISDIKTREVPDWLNYGAILTGLSLNLLFTFITQDPKFIINSVIGFSLLFVLAHILFYTGQWGGGDSKAIMGLGALIGFDILNLNTKVPILITFLINSAIIGALYGLFWSFTLALLNIKLISPEFKKKLATKKVILPKILIILFAIFTLTLLFISNDNLLKFFSLGMLTFISLTFYLWILIAVVEKTCLQKYLSPDKITEGDWINEEIIQNKKTIIDCKNRSINTNELDKIKKIASDIDFKIKIKRKNIIFLNKNLNINLSKLKSKDIILQNYNVEHLSLKKDSKIDQDILDNIKIYLNFNDIANVSIIRKILFFKFKKNIDPINVKSSYIIEDKIIMQNYVCGPKDLGINKNQIELLKKLKIKKVLVKIGIPFIPSFFIAFIVTIFLGNIIFIFI